MSQISGKEIRKPLRICSRVVARTFVQRLSTFQAGRNNNASVLILRDYWGTLQSLNCSPKGKKHVTTEAESPKVSFQTHARGDDVRTFEDDSSMTQILENREGRWTTCAFSISPKPEPICNMKEYYIDKKIRNRNPDVSILGQRCFVKHRLPDGYWLMEFPEIKIWNMKQRKKLPLRWYIHKDDLLSL